VGAVLNAEFNFCNTNSHVVVHGNTRNSENDICRHESLCSYNHCLISHFKQLSSESVGVHDILK